jgi:hypothetical protein
MLPRVTGSQNRAPLPGSPVILMVNPVISEISRKIASPKPVFFPNPRSNILYHSAQIKKRFSDSPIKNAGGFLVKDRLNDCIDYF